MAPIFNPALGIFIASALDNLHEPAVFRSDRGRSPMGLLL